jgi:hypothetical protein
MTTLLSAESLRYRAVAGNGAAKHHRSLALLAGASQSKESDEQLPLGGDVEHGIDPTPLKATSSFQNEAQAKIRAVLAPDRLTWAILSFDMTPRRGAVNVAVIGNFKVDVVIGSLNGEKDVARQPPFSPALAERFRASLARSIA